MCACFSGNENEDQEEDVSDFQAEVVGSFKALFGSIPDSLDKMKNHEKVETYISQRTLEIAEEVTLTIFY